VTFDFTKVELGSQARDSLGLRNGFAVGAEHGDQGRHPSELDPDPVSGHRSAQFTTRPLVERNRGKRCVLRSKVRAQLDEGWWVIVRRKRYHGGSAGLTAA
jgi:hypothetical protein